MLEVNNLTPDLLRQNRCLRSQKILILSVKFTDWVPHVALSHLINISDLLNLSLDSR